MGVGGLKKHWRNCRSHARSSPASFHTLPIEGAETREIPGTEPAAHPAGPEERFLRFASRRGEQKEETETSVEEATAPPTPPPTPTPPITRTPARPPAARSSGWMKVRRGTLPARPGPARARAGRSPVATPVAARAGRTRPRPRPRPPGAASRVAGGIRAEGRRGASASVRPPALGSGIRAGMPREPESGGLDRAVSSSAAGSRTRTGGPGRAGGNRSVDAGPETCSLLRFAAGAIPGG